MQLQEELRADDLVRLTRQRIDESAQEALRTLGKAATGSGRTPRKASRTAPTEVTIGSHLGVSSVRFKKTG